MEQELPVAPGENGIVLRTEGFRTSIGLISNTLFWMVVALSVLTLGCCPAPAAHDRRLQIPTPSSGTNFRRAMENSMLTGMRAMDMEGRITYVNPAFCAMLGSPSPTDRPPRPVPLAPARGATGAGRTNCLLLQEVRAQNVTGGRRGQGDAQERLALRRADVRLAADRRQGQQTGWMTSMTNITEAKRVRARRVARALRSHDRAGGWTRRCRCCRCSRANCCSRTVRTGSGSAPTAAATLLLGADAGVPPPPESEPTNTIDSLGGLQ